LFFVSVILVHFCVLLFLYSFTLAF
jgi:hypothetical protein